MDKRLSRRELLAVMGCAALNPLNVVSGELAARRSEFLSWRFGLFLHFNMATFYQLEWANGYEDPLRFSPAKLDCTQWADAAVEVGMKYAVLAAKHNGAW